MSTFAKVTDSRLNQYSRSRILQSAKDSFVSENATVEPKLDLAPNLAIHAPFSSFELMKQNRLALFLHPIQAKQILGEQGDSYEREAGRVSQEVVRRMNQRTVFSDRCSQFPIEMTSHSSPLELEEDKPRKSGQYSDTGPMTPKRSDSTRLFSQLHSRGRLLPDPIRLSMEDSFGGEDFRHIRYHDDAHSLEIARYLGAEAFTFGEHIVGKIDDPEVLAHELQHERQQRRDPITPTLRSSTSSLLPAARLNQPKVQRILVRNGQVLSNGQIMAELQRFWLSPSEINCIMLYASQPVLYDLDHVRISATLGLLATPIQAQRGWPHRVPHNAFSSPYPRAGFSLPSFGAGSVEGTASPYMIPPHRYPAFSGQLWSTPFVSPQPHATSHVQSQGWPQPHAFSHVQSQDWPASVSTAFPSAGAPFPIPVLPPVPAINPHFSNPVFPAFSTANLSFPAAFIPASPLSDTLSSPASDASSPPLRTLSAHEIQACLSALVGLLQSSASQDEKKDQAEAMTATIPPEQRAWLAEMLYYEHRLNLNYYLPNELRTYDFIDRESRDAEERVRRTHKPIAIDGLNIESLQTLDLNQLINAEHLDGRIEFAPKKRRSIVNVDGTVQELKEIGPIAVHSNALLGTGSYAKVKSSQGGVVKIQTLQSPEQFALLGS